VLIVTGQTGGMAPQDPPSNSELPHGVLQTADRSAAALAALHQPIIIGPPGAPETTR